MNNNLVGKIIKSEREKYGLTIPMLAGVLGITPINLRDIELGNTLPSLELLQKMEEKLKFECSSCIEFVLFYADKCKKKENVKKEVPPVLQVCYEREEPDEDYFYDRRNGNYL